MIIGAFKYNLYQQPVNKNNSYTQM